MNIRNIYELISIVDFSQANFNENKFLHANFSHKFTSLLQQVLRNYSHHHHRHLSKLYQLVSVH